MANEIIVCCHCEERISGGRYCKNCRTKEQRDAMDKENEEIGKNLKKKYGGKPN